MALNTDCRATKSFTGNGVTTTFQFNFELINDSDLYVAFYDDQTQEYTDVTGWSKSPTFNSVVFDTPPANGQIFIIYRLTYLNKIKSEFVAGSPVSSTDLNDNFKQLQFAIEDIRCRTSGSEGFHGADGADGADGDNVQVSSNPPPFPEDGTLWYSTDNCKLYVYFTDSNSSQWVQTNATRDQSNTIGSGTALVPGLRFISDEDTGIYRDAEDTIAFATDGTYRMKIAPLANEVGGPSLLWRTTINPYGATSTAEGGIQFTQRGRINVGTNNTFCMGLNRMGLIETPDGTPSNSVNYINFKFNGITISGAGISATNPGTAGAATATSVAYNTGSDYRLKENIAPLTNAKTRVNQLDVYRFNFTGNPSGTVDGFIAHEAQAVVPEAVTGYYNEVDSDGEPVYQGIDQAKFVPLLAAGLKEAYAEIAALTTRIQTLEDNINGA